MLNTQLTVVSSSILYGKNFQKILTMRKRRKWKEPHLWVWVSP